MKTILSILILVFSLARLLNAGSKNAHDAKIISTYFPINNNVTLIYNSSFGKSTARYSYDNEYLISLNEGDRFKYIQKMIIKKDGVYVNEVYQYLKLFLFVKKESRYTYNQPVLRLPLPLTVGKEWQASYDEYSNDDTNKVKLSGKVIGNEFIKTTLGYYETIKVHTVIESGTCKNSVTEWFSAGIGLVKAKIIIEGGGILGFARDLLGYDEINFELAEIRNNQ